MPARAYHKLFLHATWATKHREPIVKEQIETFLEEQIKSKAQELQIKILDFNSTTDHVHLLLNLKPIHTPCKVIKDLKGNSAYNINEKFKNDLPLKFEWQRGYGILSLSEKEIPYVSQYIQNQKEHHEKNTIELKLEDRGQE